MKIFPHHRKRLLPSSSNMYDLQMTLLIMCQGTTACTSLTGNRRVLSSSGLLSLERACLHQNSKEISQLHIFLCMLFYCAELWNITCTQTYRMLVRQLSVIISWRFPGTCLTQKNLDKWVQYSWRLQKFGIVFWQWWVQWVSFSGAHEQH